MKKFVFSITGILLFILIYHSSANSAGITITDTLIATMDNTLYEDSEGLYSNGLGQYFFAGVSNTNSIKRGLLYFNPEFNIPPGAEILDVKLRLYMSRTNSGSKNVEIYKVDNKYWGEGSSDATGEEGSGALAEMYDATWIHNYYDTEYWLNPGGDYVSLVSASTIVDGIGYYEWSSPQMIDDVTDWINFDLNNFGWIIIGDETSNNTSKRFNSVQNPDYETRPRLIITYTINNPSLIFTAMTEGLHHVDEGYVLSDTFNVLLKNNFPPYSTADSVFKVHAFLSGISFPNATAGSYYIALKQRNSIETWSNVPKAFTIGPAAAHYFTSNDSLAYGNNMVLEKWYYCMYSGDVDQNGVIDGTDGGIIDNDISNFSTGYIITDIDGNYVTDGTDGAICDNNIANFVSKVTP